ncbi:neuromast-expressed gpi-anchored lymphocyte antigen 6 isoform X2 [Pseudorasbora parva]|uniref:neuromast-expressed gpi-anchored lymphocyte antigen 6 isoform X2 n=1 Tax=Pseudorasbora parva TaxID=51549 RepID=UPI00351F7304
MCVTASVNFGTIAVVMNNQCCNTNLCNDNQSEPGPPRRIPNGIQCYTCKGENCSSTLPCADEEDHCIKATVNTDGKIIMKGCATRSLCDGDLSNPIGQTSVTVDLTCCKGHLCNSAQTVTPGRLFQLGLLVYAIVHTSF